MSRQLQAKIKWAAREAIAPFRLATPQRRQSQQAAVFILASGPRPVDGTHAE
jgi:hypothetical protein